MIGAEASHSRQWSYPKRCKPMVTVTTTFARWFGSVQERGFARPLAISGLLLGLLVATLQSAYAVAPPKFDHDKTGVPLTGAHKVTACESCHFNNTFKGTPRLQTQS